jgi:hypothetical protein
MSMQSADEAGAYLADAHDTACGSFRNHFGRHDGNVGESIGRCVFDVAIVKSSSGEVS